MNKKFKTPKHSCQNVISFTCSDSALENIIEFLNGLKCLGEVGVTRDVIINFDGDGGDKVDYINVNGLSLSEWDIENTRLKEIDRIYNCKKII